jgi:hypothetical protein
MSVASTAKNLLFQPIGSVPAEGPGSEGVRWPEIDVPIDASGVLPDGTNIEGYLDFKKWLVANIDLVSECLAEKLMIYATGRVPSYAEQVEIKAIVDRVTGEGGGFRDLLIALIESKTFRTR